MNGVCITLMRDFAALAIRGFAGSAAVDVFVYGHREASRMKRHHNR